MRTWLGVVLCAVVVPLVFLGCGDDNDGVGGGGFSQADVQRYCNTLCSKQDECGFLGMAGMTIDQCVSTCASGDGGGAGGDTDCNPSRSEVDACISAFDALSCDDMMGGNVPSECDLCDDNGGADVGTGQDAGGFDAGSGTCGDLAACCDQLPEAARGACETVASAGVQQACSATLDPYRTSGLCQ